MRRRSAKTPDQFLVKLFGQEPHVMFDIVRDQAAVLRRPPRSFEEVVVALAQVTRFDGKGHRVRHVGVGTTDRGVSLVVNGRARNDESVEIDGLVLRGSPVRAAAPEERAEV